MARALAREGRSSSAGCRCHFKIPYGCLAWIGRRGDLSWGGFACRGFEFAMLWMAASHGLIACGDLSESDRVLETRVRPASHGCLAWIRTMTHRSRICSATVTPRGIKETSIIGAGWGISTFVRGANNVRKRHFQLGAPGLVHHGLSTVKFACRQCTQRFEVDDSWPGGQVDRPTSGGVVILPQAPVDPPVANVVVPARGRGAAGLIAGPAVVAACGGRLRRSGGG